jgi:hypothetical protein
VTGKFKAYFRSLSPWSLYSFTADRNTLLYKSMAYTHMGSTTLHGVRHNFSLYFVTYLLYRIVFKINFVYLNGIYIYEVMLLFFCTMDYFLSS